MQHTKVIVHGRFIFIITPDRIYIQSPLQTFYLQPMEPYWRRRVRFIGTLMEIGEVDNLNTLAHYCEDKIRWIPTKRREEEQGVLI